MKVLIRKGTFSDSGANEKKAGDIVEISDALYEELKNLCVVEKAEKISAVPTGGGK
jgi:hypothetical protein